MSQFNLWFAYYDSLFLNPQPKFSHKFYLDILPPYSDKNININWPRNVCPQVSILYQLLENFIKEVQNWEISKCKQTELRNIERLINNLLHFLKLEKFYAYSFWQQDHRRIQASVLHFYTFLQMFISAIIPYRTMTIFQCKTANKLCIKMPKLQKFMNELLKCINPIAKFLSAEKFKQQSKLIRNFFENWIYMMKNLPKIKRNKFNHVHKLMKYICLSNPIEICADYSSNIYENKIRKKSNTVGTKVCTKTMPPLINYKYHYKSSINLEKLIDIPDGNQMKAKDNKKQKKFIKQKQQINSYNQNIPRYRSCINFKTAQNTPNSELQQQYTKTQQKYILQNKFSLPENIIKYAIQQQIRNKTHTYGSLTTLQNKFDNLSKNRTLTTTNFIQGQKQLQNNSSLIDKNSVTNKRQKAKSYYPYRSPTKSPKKRQTNKTISISNQDQTSQANSQKSKSISKPRSRRRTKFYQLQSQRNQQTLSQRSSKQSSIRHRQLSIMTMIMKKDINKNQQHEELINSQIRQYLGEQILFNKKLTKISVQTGEFVKKSKWDVVRKYLREKIVQRKLSKIINN